MNVRRISACGRFRMSRDAQPSFAVDESGDIAKLGIGQFYKRFGRWRDTTRTPEIALSGHAPVVFQLAGSRTGIPGMAGTHNKRFQADDTLTFHGGFHAQSIEEDA